MRLFALVLLACSVSCLGQPFNKDSLHLLLAHSKEDTGRVELLTRLAEVYVYVNPDSCYYFAALGLDLAARLGDRREQAESLCLMGGTLVLFGHFPQALKLELRSLELGEQSGDEVVVVDALNAIGALYHFEKEHKRELEYFIRSLDNCHGRHPREMGRELANLGDAYFELSRFDSALYFSKKAYQLSASRGDLATMSDELENLGQTFVALNQDELAHQYFREAMARAIQASSSYDFSGVSLSAARLYRKEKKEDSALSFAYRSFAVAKAAKLTNQQLDACIFIEDIFESQKQTDSSLRYLKLTIALQDSLFSEEKSKEIQTMTLEENIRQRDLERQKKQAEENAANNAQLIAIALFIPVFFLIVLLLARIRVRARVIEFLAVVNLLLLFEFITDVVFPYISAWTHDSPIWEMLILVSIAALLEPLNYRIERWVKVKLIK